MKNIKRCIITILLIILSCFVYTKTGKLGILAQNSDFYLFLAIISWFWLMCGQFAIYELIWE